MIDSDNVFETNADAPSTSRVSERSWDPDAFGTSPGPYDADGSLAAETVAQLNELAGLPPTLHADVYEDLHRRLARALDEPADG